MTTELTGPVQGVSVWRHRLPQMYEGNMTAMGSSALLATKSKVTVLLNLFVHIQFSLPASLCCTQSPVTGRSVAGSTYRPAGNHMLSIILWKTLFNTSFKCTEILGCTIFSNMFQFISTKTESTFANFLRTKCKLSETGPICL